MCNNKKRDQVSPKRLFVRKIKAETALVKMVSPPTNVMSEQATALPFHISGTSKLRIP